MNKLILTVATAGLSIVGASGASVYMTGSTAMRSIVYVALTNAGTVFQSTPSITTYGGSGSGATYMAFQGTLVGGSGTTTIQCDWSGSEAGYLDLVNNQSENFIPSGLIDGNDHGSALPSSFDVEPVDLAMADNAQAFSRTKTPSVGKSAEVGVITFEWVRNNGLWQGTNVTDAQIRQALNGYCVRAVFSGVATDTNDYVYVSGRDSLSGTRVNGFGDSSYGIFSLPYQIEMNNAGVMQDLDGNGTYAGDYGFSGGGSLAATMGATTTSASDLWNGKTGYSVIAYLGVGDADTAIADGAKLLTYDGVAFSPQAVIEGTYTFWGNEYINEKSGDSNTDADKVYSSLSDETNGISKFCDGRKAISLTAMHCTRFGPTTDPIHN